MWRIELLLSIRKVILTYERTLNKKIGETDDWNLKIKYLNKMADGVNVLKWTDRKIDKILQKKLNQVKRIKNLLE